MNHATARGMGDRVCSPDYLAEFVRAQNYPHLKIHINFSRGTKSDSVGGKAGRTPDPTTGAVIEILKQPKPNSA
jgi:hypothetical protein